MNGHVAKMIESADKMLQNIAHMRTVDEMFDAQVRMTVGKFESNGYCDLDALALPSPDAYMLYQSFVTMLTSGIPAALVPTVVRTSFLTAYVMGVGGTETRGGDSA